ncbi:hypothetical protein Tco_1428855 [Tanacetum coccineum]
MTTLVLLFLSYFIRVLSYQLKYNSQHYQGSNEPYSEPDIDLEIQAEINECIAYADALRAKGIDARVVVKTVAQEEVKTSARGLVERLAEALEARDASKNLEPLVEGGGEQGDKNGDDYEGGNGGGNRNRGVNENGNGGGNINGNDNRNGNGNEGGNGYNFGGFMLVARERFQELVLLYTRMVPNEEDKVERFNGGFPDNIQGNGYARNAENKRRLHHEGPCTMRYENYKRVGHMTRDCTAAVALNTHMTSVRNQPGVVCYECGRPRHYRKDYPKLRNQNYGNKTRNKIGNKTGAMKLQQRLILLEEEEQTPIPMSS